MADIKVGDFYYGSVISVFLNKGITPALIESGEDRQIYDLTSLRGKAKLFAKYRTDKTNTATEDYNSWTFSFTNAEVDELYRLLESNLKLVLALVCGSSIMSESELALLDAADIQKVLDLGKNSITISRKKHERKYRIAVGGGRSKSLTVKCNRLNDLFFSS